MCTFELKDSFLQANIEEGLRYDMSGRVWLDFNQEHIMFFEKSVEISKR